jgi:hypothetical protein
VIDKSERAYFGASKQLEFDLKLMADVVEPALQATPAPVDLSAHSLIAGSLFILSSSFMM